VQQRQRQAEDEERMRRQAREAALEAQRQQRRDLEAQVRRRLSSSELQRQREEEEAAAATVPPSVETPAPATMDGRQSGGAQLRAEMAKRLADAEKRQAEIRRMISGSDSGAAGLAVATATPPAAAAALPSDAVAAARERALGAWKEAQNRASPKSSPAPSRSAGDVQSPASGVPFLPAATATVPRPAKGMSFMADSSIESVVKIEEGDNPFLSGAAMTTMTAMVPEEEDNPFLALSPMAPEVSEDDNPFFTVLPTPHLPMGEDEFNPFDEPTGAAALAAVAAVEDDFNPFE